jgi:hypothetical protein
MVSIIHDPSSRAGTKGESSSPDAESVGMTAISPPFNAAVIVARTNRVSVGGTRTTKFCDGFDAVIVPSGAQAFPSAECSNTTSDAATPGVESLPCESESESIRVRTGSAISTDWRRSP